MKVVKFILDILKKILAELAKIPQAIGKMLKAGQRKHRRADDGNSSSFKVVVAIMMILIMVVVIIFLGSKLLNSTSSVGVKSNNGYLSYSDFMENVKKGNIASVIIKSDRVELVTENGEQYYTDNPKYERFREKLLLHDIEVTDQTEGVGDTIVNLMDFLFNILFFGLVIFGVYKFMGMTGATGFKLIKDTGVDFDDVCGLDDLEDEMISIASILQNPQQYERRGIRPTKGIILEGPPGNGKTLFAKALATEANVNFIATKGADFQSAFMSVGTMKTKNLFKKARRHRPCIIFIDEFDSIGERRNYAGTGIDKENNRIITTLLNLMDGFDSEDGILVIAATNSYHSLDPALTRPGRFDMKFHIGNPNHQTIMELIDLYTSDKAVTREIDFEELATRFEGMSCAAIETVLNVAATTALENKKRVITMEYIEEAIKKVSAEA